MVPRVLILLLATSSPCLATSYVMPKRHNVFSPNRSFVLDVDPKTQVHTVYRVGEPAQPLWSFSFAVWHQPFLLSNDGTVVAIVGWEHIWAQHVDEGAAVLFWNKDGVFRTYTVGELCPDPPKTKDVGLGPIGDFWRTWYTEVQQDESTMVLQTTRGVEYRFRLKDGEMLERRLIGWRAWGPWVVTAGVLALVAVVSIWWGGRRRRRQLAALDLQTTGP